MILSRENLLFEGRLSQGSWFAGRLSKIISSKGDPRFEGRLSQVLHLKIDGGCPRLFRIEETQGLRGGCPKSHI